MSAPPPISIIDHNGRPWSEQTRRDRAAEPIPHVWTFAGVLGAATRDIAYWHDQWDEARRDGRAGDARAMVNDAFLMALVNERRRSVYNLDWAVKVDDEKDPHQKMVRDHLQGTLDRMRGDYDFASLLQWQTWNVWFGRAGSQVKWKWAPQKSRGFPQAVRTLTVARHIPINGDKIGHTRSHVPYVLVYAGEDIPGARYEHPISNQGGKALLLEGSWRERFILSKHQPFDADFADFDAAEAVHGVGLRSVLYWNNWLRLEWLSRISDFIDRIGLGITLFEYEDGNASAKEAMERAAREQTGRVNIVLPKKADGSLRNDVRRIEIPTAGAEFLLKLEALLADRIERFIIGQSMSSGNDSEGSLGGTGRAKFAEDTKHQIIREDARRLGSQMTGSADSPSLLYTIQRHTFPWVDFPCWLEPVLDETDPEARLSAIKTVVDMGVAVKADDARTAAGLTKPDPTDELVQSPQAMQQQRLAQQAEAAQQGGGDVPPGGGAGPADDDSLASVFEELIGRKEEEEGSSGGDGPEQFDRDDDPELYVAEDWVREPGPRSKNRWRNTRTGRIVYSPDNPAVKSRERSTVKRERTKAQRESSSAALEQEIKGKLGKLTEGDVRSLSRQLRDLGLNELRSLYKRLFPQGRARSGVPNQLALKVLDEADGQGEDWTGEGGQDVRQEERGAEQPAQFDDPFMRPLLDRAVKDIGAPEPELLAAARKLAQMDGVGEPHVGHIAEAANYYANMKKRGPEWFKEYDKNPVWDRASAAQTGYASLQKKTAAQQPTPSPMSPEEATAALGSVAGDLPTTPGDTTSAAALNRSLKQEAQPPTPEPTPAPAAPAAGEGESRFAQLVAAASDPATSPADRMKALAAARRHAVEQALAQGKPVPPEILADYPDLAPQPAAQPAPPAAAEPAAQAKPKPARKPRAKAAPKEPVAPEQPPAAQGGGKPIGASIADAVRDWSQGEKRAADMPTQALYDSLKKQHPNLTPEQFRKTLADLDDAGHLRLTAWSGSIDRIPNPELAVSQEELEGEPRPANLRQSRRLFVYAQHSNANLDAIRGSTQQPPAAQGGGDPAHPSHPIHAAFDRAPGARDNFVYLSDLQKQMPGMTTQQLHAMVTQLRQSGKYELVKDEGYSNQPEQQAAALTVPGAMGPEKMIALQRKQQSAPAAPKPATPPAAPKTPAGPKLTPLGARPVPAPKDSLPGKTPEQSVQAVKDAMAEQKLYHEHRDGLVPIERLYHEMKQRDPSLTVDDLHALLTHMGKQRQVELKVLNEVHQIPQARRAMSMERDGRLLHYVFMPGQ